MADKTPLERDIETRELVRTPGIIKVIILILSSALIIVSLYTLFLKQEMMKKDQKILLIQEKYQNERSILLEELRELRNRMASEIKNGDHTN
ncbi:MAG: hypothetical protein JSW20_09490 [Nitrospiraceae bacterium]|nr:MAG: hypothetical protein JSW20_09490 [Nitrospiraceae bacterium]